MVWHFSKTAGIVLKKTIEGDIFSRRQEAKK
jgi:hypothetical protein